MLDIAIERGQSRRLDLQRHAELEQIAERMRGHRACVVQPDMVGLALNDESARALSRLISPSLRSWQIASRTTVRLTVKLRVSASSAGSRPPGFNAPTAI